MSQCGAQAAVNSHILKPGGTLPPRLAAPFRDPLERYQRGLPVVLAFQDSH
jgi:hypothetical protein